MCEAMREWIREEYADEIEEAKKVACQKAIIRNDSLIAKLSELGRNDDILKAVTNPEFKKQLFQEFGI